MAKQTYGSVIDGELKGLAAGSTFYSVNPATETHLTEIAICSRVEVNSAVNAARREYDHGVWPRMTCAERASKLLNLADFLEDNIEAFSRLETMDTGIPLRLTRQGHLPRAISHFRFFAEQIQFFNGECFNMGGAYQHLVNRESMGVIGLLTPWNAPLSVASIHLAAALVCGNTVVLKPSELAPLTTSLLVQACAAADFPPGVVNLVHGPGDPTGQSLVSHPQLDMICFTGGNETAREIMGVAAKGLKRVFFELGGKSPALVFQDADMEAAIDGLLLSTFSNNGEACFASSRIFIEKPIFKTFLDRFIARASNIRVGDPMLESTEMGPLINQSHYQKVAGMVQRAEQMGGTRHCGGPAENFEKGFFMRPVVFSDISSDMEIFQKEVFGPVAALMPFEDEVEAIQLANDSAFGLAGYVWTRNSARGLKLARQIRAGTIAINTCMVRDIRCPFGGFKESGMGRVGGRYSLEMFTEPKTQILPLQGYPLPRLGLNNENQ